MKCYAAVADWEGYLQWKTSNTNWNEASDSYQQQRVDLVEFFDRNIPAQWPDRTPPMKVAEWSADSLMEEAKSSMLMAGDRIRSSRSVHSAPDSAWKILQYLTASNLELGELSSSSSKEEVLPWLPICHALSHKNDSAYQWMEHLRSVLKGATCTQLTFSKVAISFIRIPIRACTRSRFKQL